MRSKPWYSLGWRCWDRTCKIQRLVGIEPRFPRAGPGSEGTGEALKCIRFLLGLMKCSKICWGDNGVSGKIRKAMKHAFGEGSKQMPSLSQGIKTFSLSFIRICLRASCVLCLPSRLPYTAPYSWDLFPISSPPMKIFQFCGQNHAQTHWTGARGCEILGVQ